MLKKSQYIITVFILYSLIGWNKFQEHESQTWTSGTRSIWTHTNKPPHDKTNKMACAPSEDSNQPGHLPSLIRVFAVRMKKAWVLSYPLSPQWRLWVDAQADLSLRWAHSNFVGFVMSRLKCLRRPAVYAFDLITWTIKIRKCCNYPKIQTMYRKNCTPGHLLESSPFFIRWVGIY